MSHVRMRITHTSRNHSLSFAKLRAHGAYTKKQTLKGAGSFRSMTRPGLACDKNKAVAFTTVFSSRSNSNKRTKSLCPDLEETSNIADAFTCILATACETTSESFCKKRVLATICTD